MNAIRILGLTKEYRGRKAVDRLELSIPAGELFALLGVNGAGKSTTIKMLSCLTVPTEGDAELMGHSVRTQPHKAREVLAVSPQETAVALGLPLRWNLLAVVVSLIPSALLFIALGLLCSTLFNDKQVDGVCGAVLTNVTGWLAGIWFDLSLVAGRSKPSPMPSPLSTGRTEAKPLWPATGPPRRARPPSFWCGRRRSWGRQRRCFAGK